MAAYHRVYDKRHLQADCQEPGSAPEPYARLSSMGYLFTFYLSAIWQYLLGNTKGSQSVKICCNYIANIVRDPD